jgi:hypothetical protein
VDSSNSQSVRKYDINTLREYLRQATGEMLVVWDAIREIGPRPRLINETVSLSSIPPDSSPVTVKFFLHNIGDTPFKIQNIRTSCGCLGSPQYDSLVNPGKVATIKVLFDPRAVVPGDGARNILIETDASKTGLLTGTIQFNIRQDTSKSTIFSVNPRSVTFGRVKATTAATVTPRFFLTIPQDATQYGESIRVLVDCRNKNIAFTLESTTQNKDGATVLVYRVTLESEPAAQSIDDVVTFRIWNKNTSAFDVATVSLSGTFY